MSDQVPNRAEEALKAYAKKRREQAGAPFEPHPATLRALRQEADRVHGQAAKASGQTFSWLAIWPRLAVAFSLCLFVCGTVWLVIEGDRMSNASRTVAAKEEAPLAAVMDSDSGVQLSKETANRGLGMEAEKLLKEQDARKMDATDAIRPMVRANGSSAPTAPKDTFSDLYATSLADAGKAVVREEDESKPKKRLGDLAAADGTVEARVLSGRLNAGQKQELAGARAELSRQAGAAQPSRSLASTAEDLDRKSTTADAERNLALKQPGDELKPYVFSPAVAVDSPASTTFFSVSGQAQNAPGTPAVLNKSVSDSQAFGRASEKAELAATGGAANTLTVTGTANYSAGGIGGAPKPPNFYNWDYSLTPPQDQSGHVIDNIQAPQLGLAVNGQSALNRDGLRLPVTNTNLANQAGSLNYFKLPPGSGKAYDGGYRLDVAQGRNYTISGPADAPAADAAVPAPQLAYDALAGIKANATTAPALAQTTPATPPPPPVVANPTPATDSSALGSVVAQNAITSANRPAGDVNGELQILREKAAEATKNAEFASRFEDKAVALSVTLSDEMRRTQDSTDKSAREETLAQNSRGAAVHYFRYAATPAVAAKEVALKTKAAMPFAVLSDFTVTVNGSAVRVTDADGSVYEGQFVNPGGFAGGGGGGAGEVRTKSQEEFKKADAKAVNPTGQSVNYLLGPASPAARSFQVTGANRTLQEVVVFQGSIPPDAEPAAVARRTTAGESVRMRSITPAPAAKPAEPSPEIQGTFRVGNSAEQPLKAARAPR